MSDKKQNKRNNNKNYDEDYNPKFRKQRKKVCVLCSDKNFELDYKKKDVLAAKNKIIGNNITVVGFFDRAVYEGEEYELEGDYVKDKNYGLQFKFTKFARKAIDNAYGIVAYLSSDLFPGIGIKIAKMVVEKLGVDAIELIKHNPDVLNEIAITPKQRSIIYSGILSDKNNQEAEMLLAKIPADPRLAYRWKLGLGLKEVMYLNLSDDKQAFPDEF